MAFVDDDEVEEVGRIIAEARRGLAGRIAAGHEGLEDGEEDVAVLRHAALLADDLGVDPHQRVFGEGRERVVGLVGEDVAVGQEQDARTAGRLAFALPVGEVPSALEQLPGELEGDEGLAGAGRQRQQDAVLPRGDGLQRAPDGDVLVVARLPVAALVLERDGGEAVAPDVLLGKDPVPEFVRGGVLR